MKMPPKKDVIISVVLLLTLAVVSITMYDNTRSRTVYSSRTLFLTQQYLMEAAESNNGVLPYELPDSITISGSKYVLADPFDTKKKKNSTLLKCHANLDDFMGGVNSFRFKGNKIKYIRFSDRHGIIYSFGPDLDDDLLKYGHDNLFRWIKSKKDWDVTIDEYSNEPIRNFIYDPANGKKSDGDIFRIISMDIYFSE